MSEQGTHRGAGSPSPVSVERITHQDVPAICALYKRVWEPAPDGVPSEFVKSWIPTPLEFTSWMEGITYFAARRDGRVVGVVGLEMRRGTGRLVHLAVDPDARRQGVATALVKAGLDWARHANAPAVWTDALAKFPGAADLFRHLGFKDAGLLHRHEWGEDIRLFELLL